MKRYLRTVLAVVLCLTLSQGFLVQYAYAAWVAVEDFNSYSDATNLNTLNGGSGWNAGWVETNAGTFKTTAASTYEGAEAVAVTISTGDNAERKLSVAPSGAFTMYVAMRRTLNNLGSSRFDLRDTADNNTCELIFNASGNVTIGGASPTTIITGYSANTWYVFRVKYNGGGSSCLAATTTNSTYQGGGTWSADSANGGTRTANDVNYILFDTPTATIATDSWDYVSSVDPLPSTSVSFGYYSIQMF